MGGFEVWAPWWLVVCLGCCIAIRSRVFPSGLIQTHKSGKVFVLTHVAVSSELLGALEAGRHPGASGEGTASSLVLRFACLRIRVRDVRGLDLVCMLQYGRPLRLSSIGCLEHFVMLVAIWCSFVSKLIRGNHGMRLSRRCDLSLKPGSETGYEKTIDGTTHSLCILRMEIV